MLTRTRMHFIILLCSFVSILAVLPLSAFSKEEIEVVRDETGLYYTIQKGDTLWDLSEKFLDSPWVWPDLWEQNKQIPNPHLIYPGNRIRLYQKEWEQALPEPVEEKEPPVIEEPVVEEPEPEEPEIEIQYYTYAQIDSISFLEIETKEERKKYLMKNIKEFITPYIYEVKDKKEMISQWDLVYIRQPEGSPLIIGSRHKVYRTRILTDNETDEYIGTEYMMVGIVEITKNFREGYFEATVVRSFWDIEKYDLIMPYTRRSQEIPMKPLVEKGGTDTISGKIIAAQGNPSIFGEGEIAFIDKGSNDGVETGQLFSVYYHEKQVDPVTEEEILSNPFEYGTLLVLYPRKNTSTVLITKSSRAIRQGALFTTKYLSSISN